MRPRRDQQYSGVVISTPGVQTTSEVEGAVRIPNTHAPGGRGVPFRGCGVQGSSLRRRSWNRSLLKWQMIWTSRQEMRGPQPPFRCSAQHYVRTASWCSKAGHVRSWRCLPPRRASMAMPRSTWSELTSLLARNTKISARPLIIWMSPTSKGMTSS
ncbi:eukaryotic translation initiation factor 5A-1 isoform X2 [Mustela nigripes]|uniref:eukaryotic translation initiation factor 5A-1 isoform X2 n=1 Tax=Mustela nigripes TaxID=77151 RepID=UPI002814AF52|nr:eukaryotic translation initiation factor 5A-1 isoform X2 [Mustela nigripes]